MACCDTCPLDPTCEEMADFLDQIGLPAEFDPYDGTDPHDLGYCVTPGCRCCGGDH